LIFYSEDTGSRSFQIIVTCLGNYTVSLLRIHNLNTGGADKSLAGPGRKQGKATEDFDVHIPYL